MENQTAKIIKTMNTISAHQSVLQYLLLAVFDEMPKKNQTKIAAKFIATTQIDNNKSISEGRAKTYLFAFQQSQKVILEVLQHEIERVRH